MPSGAPSGPQLCKDLCEAYQIDYDSTLSLADIGTLVELKGKRKDMVRLLAAKLGQLRPTQGLLNLPTYDWKDIFTTNYDELIEKTYTIAKRELGVYASNFDFDDRIGGVGTSLHKLHGTINVDRSTGHKSSMVISNGDYELATEFREQLFDRLLHETSRHDVLIIGH